MKSGWHKETISLNDPIEKIPLRIIHDGAIAIRGLGDGKLFPLVIIDASSRPDVKDMIKAHKHVGPGDAATQWGRLSNNKKFLCLVLTIIRPSHCIVILEFDLYHRAGFVDQVVQSKGLYLQSGQDGDTLTSTQGADRVLVEVPSREFRKEWEQIFRQAVEKRFRKEGLSKRDSRQKSEDFIHNWRNMVKIRMQSE